MQLPEKNIRQPPMIHHCNQTEYIQRGASLVQMAADACAAMYLPDRVKKLLTFYADCPDGFRPALNTVHDKTGMNESSICKARKELVDVGFLLYTPDEIRIDWQRVATMAMLPPEACFGLRRRSMAERAKVEKIKPAFWKPEPMKWTTPKVLVINPDENKRYFCHSYDRPKIGKRQTMNSFIIQQYMTADGWKTCREIRIRKILLALQEGGKIYFPACGNYHKTKNC